MAVMGIQLKGFLIGLLFAYFVIPWVQRTMLKSKAVAS
jgi:antibiotic biosynthesis monooxygenase (ABM) superfamily enzyme